MELQATIINQDNVQKISERCFDYGSEGEKHKLLLLPKNPWLKGHKLFQYKVVPFFFFLEDLYNLSMLPNLRKLTLFSIRLLHPWAINYLQTIVQT